MKSSSGKATQKIMCNYGVEMQEINFYYPFMHFLCARVMYFLNVYKGWKKYENIKIRNHNFLLQFSTLYFFVLQQLKIDLQLYRNFEKYFKENIF